LTHLRRALSEPEVLLASGDHVGLDPRRVWSDVVAFERLCVALTPTLTPHPLRRGEWGEDEALQQAVDLYRGPFLAGFSLPGSPEFEAWATQERHAWERLYLEALAALIEERTARGEYDAAIPYARRYLETDDLAEEVHRCLIELYATIGDRSSALRQFERCTAVLERELGVRPLPETRAVYQAVLEGRPPPLRRAVPAPTWTTLPSLDAPLVGRDEALRLLKRAFARARSGYGGVVLISGEAGIGKSRLMQDFVTRLEGEATVVVGGGHEAEQGMPYWPLVEALRPHLPAIDWVALGVEPFYLAEVSRLWPELRTLLPDLPALTSVEPDQEQSRLFQALVHWLLSLAAQRPPLILCLDDLHWADEATLSWLGYLARQLRRAPVLVLGAYRTEEAAAVAALRAGLTRLSVLREVRLEGLPVADVLRLVRHLSGQSSSAELLSQRLHRETGGNPFFLLETLRAMFEAGILWEDETGWSTGVDEITEDYRELPLPDTVYEAIRDRLRRLSPQARQVLEAGAVIGHQFNFELVCATSGRREGEVVDALDVLSARQVLSEHESRYRF
jgi:DNA-binding SARP family transcriptional activator